jgi:hypothetical protein
MMSCGIFANGGGNLKIKSKLNEGSIFSIEFQVVG